MATEVFSDWTQVDPNSRITATASKMSWAGLKKNETAYGYYDYGAAHFAGDFEHLLTLYIDSSSAADIIGYYLMTNDIDELEALITADKSFLFIGVINYTPLQVYLQEIDSGEQYTDYFATAAVDTPYYCKFKRDEAISTYGTIYLYIYSDAARTILVDTLSVALHTSKKDFRYLMCPCTYNNSGTGGDTGYVENLDLQEAAAPTAYVMTSVAAKMIAMGLM